MSIKNTSQKNVSNLSNYFLLLIVLVFSFLFLQNFIFSSSFDILMFRSVDDFAFQHTLRRNHENILNLDFNKLTVIYDYGYGWLFWIIHVILTFPLFLLSQHGIDFPLIAGARDISLLFMAGSCYFLFQIFKNYTEDKYIPYFAVLFYMSFPYFAFSAMSFRTIAQGSFFAILTFFLTIRNTNLSKKDLKYIALSLAACFGTKLSVGLIAPLIGVIMIERLGWTLNKKNIRNALYFFMYFLPATIVFLNPSLVFSPFKKELFYDYFHVLQFYIKQTNTSLGLQPSTSEILHQAFVGQYLVVGILIILFILLGVGGIYNHLRAKSSRKFDFIITFLFLSTMILYLVSTIKLGPYYITNYAYSFSFLILLPLVFFEHIKNKYILISIFSIIFIVNIWKNFGPIEDKYFEFFIKKIRPA